MELLKYREALGKSEEDASAALIDLQAEQAKKAIELEIAKTEETLLRCDMSVKSVASHYPLDLDKLVEAMDERSLLARKRDQLKRIASELFD